LNSHPGAWLLLDETWAALDTFADAGDAQADTDTAAASAAVQMAAMAGLVIVFRGTVLAFRVVRIRRPGPHDHSVSPPALSQTFPGVLRVAWHGYVACASSVRRTPQVHLSPTPDNRVGRAVRHERGRGSARQARQPLVSRGIPS
jgi:hypothetical protein